MMEQPIRAWACWALGTAFAILVFTLQTGYAITNEDVAGDLRLSLGQVGLVGTVYTWAFAVAQFFSGSLLDRLGARRVLPVACFVVALGALLFSRATGLGMLLAANVVTALGGSFGFIGAGFVGGQWFGAVRYGLMFSLVHFVSALSSLVGQRTLGSLIQSIPWDTLIAGISALAAGLGCLMLAILRDPSRSRPGTSEGRSLLGGLLEDLRHVISVRQTWVNALVGGALLGTMLAVGVVWGPRLLEAAGMDRSKAIGVNSLVWAGMAFGAPVFAWLSHRWRRRRTALLLASALQLAALVLLLVQADSSAMEVSIWFFLFGFVAGASVLAFAVGAELVPTRLLGTSAAVVNATMFTVGGILMVVPGRMLEGGAGTLADHQWAMAVIPGAAGLGLVLCLALKETFGQEIPDEEESADPLHS